MKAIPETELAAYRPIPFYYITTRDPEALTCEAFYADLTDMKEKGYGGIVLFNRPPDGFNKDTFFTEAWFDMVGNCLRASRDAGMRVWINDDYDAPPGTIGDRLQNIAPHLKPLHLVLEGDTAKVEEADWGFPAFEDPESARLFQQYVYEEYKRRFGEFFGNTVVGFFSDADSRRVTAWVYSSNGAHMRDYFPWAKDFDHRFMERYGYDITPWLISILRREPSPQSRDYWEFCGELYMGWFQSNYEWCQKNGLQYTFHTSDSAPFRIETTYFNSAFMEGKAIDSGKHCDWPGVDHEMLDLNGGRLYLRERFHMSAAVYGGDSSLRRAENFFDVYADLRAKQAQSCAFLHDKRGVMCEMYAAANWSASYKELRNIASWQMMQGVNFIVYQAYHYKLHRSTKFFAPPAFGPHSYLDFDIREFNDSITQNAYLCSLGRLAVDLALLDPTDAIWAGTGDSRTELDLAQKLNHFPQGYIISDIQNLPLQASRLKAVINPGLSLSREERSAISSLGLTLLEAEDITSPEAMEARIPTGIRWEGTGKLMFMRRILENGETMVIAGNIEQDNTVTGTLRIKDRAYEIELSSGELAFIGGGFDRYRTPRRGGCILPLPTRAKVRYEKPNILPLLRWEDETGRGFSLLRPGKRRQFILTEQWIPAHFDASNDPADPHPLFPLRAAEPLRGLELLISDRFLKQHTGGVFLDGTPLEAGGRTRVFDDPYTVFHFDLDQGTHTLGLNLINEVDIQDYLYLCGEFDVDTRISGGKSYGSEQFSMQIYLPERMEVILSARSQELDTRCSWAEQGQPFYSGYTEYEFPFKADRAWKNAYLVMPGLQHAAKVWLDSEPVGSAIFPPYEVPLPIGPGEHIVRIRAANTFGNMMEGFLAPSGLCAQLYIAYDDPDEP